jgi:hypothetical protein
VADITLHPGFEDTPDAMDLTQEQMRFLADLRKGARRAIAAQDATMTGPLIRANLVRWDDDPGEASEQRGPRGSSFTLTALGEVSLAEHEARQRLAD